MTPYFRIMQLTSGQ